MLLIALSGGTPAERVAVADRLVEAGKGHLVAFAQAEPKSERGPTRARNLREALDGLEDGEPPLGGVVVTHCLAELEAEEIRRRGGAVWHLYGQPSGYVVIRHGDPIVIDCEAGFRHIRSPLEALSELMLGKLAEAPLAGAALDELADG